jgi:hypothetical protein
MIIKNKHPGGKIKGCIALVDGRVMIRADQHQVLQLVSTTAA